ncbi:caspase family protein [Saccharothrix carnea]|uniref:caspase family protein n=1 Tax=Saccharothrix carnea TaxID=1280637 RepID=UPI0015E70905|nr:caspase family protein [Saccharothrix carnea]
MIATVVAHHTLNSAWDRPGLLEARDDVVSLFTGTLGYEHVDVLGLNPTQAQLTTELRRFSRSPQVEQYDMVAVYLGCHGARLDDGEHVLITADTDPGDVDDALPTAHLARKILKGTRVRRLLLMLDACYSGRGGNELAATALTRMTEPWTPDDDGGLVVMTSALPTDQAMVRAFPTLLREAVDSVATAGHAPPVLALDAVVAAMTPTHDDRASSTSASPSPR